MENNVMFIDGITQFVEAPWPRDCVKTEWLSTRVYSTTQ